jgi:hypothetical protein
LGNTVFLNVYFSMGRGSEELCVIKCRDEIERCLWGKINQQRAIPVIRGNELPIDADVVMLLVTRFADQERRIAADFAVGINPHSILRIPVRGNRQTTF